jgi:predicted dienelactone hydrolase
MPTRTPDAATSSSVLHDTDARRHRLVKHRYVKLGGITTFYREAGDADAPVVLLPHGYSCSSYQYRSLLPH